MAKNIVQLINKNANTDVMMNGKEAVQDVITYALNPIKSINDIDADDRLKISLSFFEQNKREEAYDALNLDDMNSKVMSSLVKFLQNDNDDSRFDLCEAIKKTFSDYYYAETVYELEEVLEDQFIEKSQEIGLKPIIDSINGEVSWG